jgi:hypothetical protein
MHDNAWSRKVGLGKIFSMEHLTLFVELSVLLNNRQLDGSVEDDISRKLTTSVQYSAQLLRKCNILSLFSPI